MLNINLVRQNAEILRNSLAKRGVSHDIIEEIQTLDELWRKSTQKLELLQAESNRLSKTKELAQTNKEKLLELKKEIGQIKLKSTEVERKLTQKTLAVPNVVFDDVPAGNEKNNKIIAQKGETTAKSPAHEEILRKNGLLNIETAATFSGSRFRYLSGAAARASQKLFQSAVALAEEHGFTLILPPVIAKAELLEATGFFPAGIDDTFSLGDGRYLIGTSEPMLLALAANKKYLAKDLPLRFVGFSTCFRKEAGSYGKDVKGVFRVHQFDKVELVSITTPEQSAKEHDFLISLQQQFVEKFAVPYQTVLLAAGDQSQIAAKQVDLECWFPSQQRYRETHSASNCTDYQSRTLKIKVTNDNQITLAHTLNATLATERLLLAIIENNVNDKLEIDWPKELVA